MICSLFLWRKVRCHKGLWKTLEPIASVGDPPGCDDDRNRGAEGPPKWQHEVGQQSEKDEAEPEDFSLHGMILCPTHIEEAYSVAPVSSVRFTREAKP